MVIVDSQVHIWAADTPQRPWRTGPRNAAHRAQPFSKDDLLREMDAAGVTRAVLVPPSMEGDRNDLVLEAAQLHPDRFAAMGRIALDQPDNEALLAAWKQPGMRGLRITFLSAGKPLNAQGHYDWLWRAAERAQLPLMIAAITELLPEITKVSEKYSGIKLAIDHLAVLRGKKDDAAFGNLDHLLRLAKRPNIAVKASALPCLSTENYPYPRLHKHIRRVYDAFGPDRIFWGSDLTRQPCTYRQVITMFTEELPWLTETDKELIMGKALCTWLGWPLPENA